jgi:ABC-type nitrate/sulfonate/bicarbonate transport system permease component
MTASLLAFLPMVSTFEIAIGAMPKQFVSMFLLSGASRRKLITNLFFPFGAPYCLQAAHQGVSASLLGALIGEFGGGEGGIGQLLNGAVLSGDLLSKWSIAVFLLSIMISILIAFSIAIKVLRSRGFSVSLVDSSILPRTIAPAFDTSPFCTILLSMVLFEFICISAGWPSPISTFYRLSAAEPESLLSHELLRSFGFALIGQCLAIALSLVLVLIFFFIPGAQSAFYPLILISQITPMVVFAPLVVHLVGRGDAALLCISVSVVFYQIFLVLHNAIREIPSGISELITTSGISAHRNFFYFRLPWGLRVIPAVATLAIPLGIQGVILAEYLVLNKGVGQLLIRGSHRISVIIAITWLVMLATEVTILVSHFLLRQVFNRRIK